VNSKGENLKSPFILPSGSGIEIPRLSINSSVSSFSIQNSMLDVRCSMFIFFNPSWAKQLTAYGTAGGNGTEGKRVLYGTGSGWSNTIGLYSSELWQCRKEALYSSKVEVSPSGSPSSLAFRSLLIIFPDLVLGRPGINCIFLGQATAWSFFLANFLMSLINSSDGS